MPKLIKNCRNKPCANKNLQDTSLLDHCLLHQNPLLAATHSCATFT